MPTSSTTAAAMNKVTLPCSNGRGWRSRSAPVMMIPAIEATPKMKSSTSRVRLLPVVLRYGAM